MRRARPGVLACLLGVAPSAFADQPIDAHGERAGVLSARRPITTERAQAAIQAADAKDSSSLQAPPAEAPPPPPRRKGVVLEQSLGALGFVGKFGGLTGHPALFLRTQLGYEIFDWLYVFGEGNMAFTDTGDSVGPSQNRPVPILGFGTGARFAFHVSPRVAVFAETVLGGDVAYVQPGALRNFGYSKAEGLGFDAAARFGLEWYQVDRHVALGVSGGLRYVMNLAYDAGSDAPLGWDATVDLRYTF